MSKHEPYCPPYTCPDIDGIIEELEKLRKANDQLRTWGEWWKEQCENAEDQVKALESHIGELEDQLEEARNDKSMD